MTETAEVCWPCVVALHHECLAPLAVMDMDNWFTCCCAGHKDDDAAAFIDEEKRGVGRPLSKPEDMKDALSTGRHRAAALYPIIKGQLCAWAGLPAAGGGIVQIEGCDNNWIEDSKSGPNAGHRHHGPDKSVLNNAPDNMSLICTTCHNRWHAANNGYYPGERPEGGAPWLPIPPVGGKLYALDGTVLYPVDTES